MSESSNNQQPQNGGSDHSLVGRFEVVKVWEPHPEWSDPDDDPMEEVVARYDAKHEADTEAKKRGSRGGDATHYATSHYVRDSSPND